MFTNVNLTDMETGYKAFVEPEITAKLTRMGCWIYDVGSAHLAVGLMQKAKRSTGETA